MKVTKLVVIGQLVVSAVLIVVFVLQRPAASKGAHGPAAAAAADGHGKPGEDGHGPKDDGHGQKDDDDGHGKAAGHGDEDDHGKGKGKSKALASAGGGHGEGEGKGAGGDPAPLAGEAKVIARALLDGNSRFVVGSHIDYDLVSQREHAAEGQHPGAMVLGCADSRVPPEMVFDRGLGELFVVRSAGNIAEPVAVGSLEYAAEHLHAKVLVVLGHDKCGAVQAALSEAKMPSPNLEAVVGNIFPAVKDLKSWADGADLTRLAVEANVRRQAEELLRRSPLLRQAVAKKEITLLKAVYDIETGRVRPL